MTVFLLTLYKNFKNKRRKFVIKNLDILLVIIRKSTILELSKLISLLTT